MAAAKTNANKVAKSRGKSAKRNRVVPTHGLSTTFSASTTRSVNNFKSNREPSIMLNTESNQVNRENILFVYLDPHSQLLPSMVTSLRAINDYVQTFNDESTCYDFLQTSTSDRFFFICPTDDKDLLKAVHDLPGVEAIFIFSSDTDMDRSRLPKIDGIYNNFEVLLLGLRETLEWFGQTQMELFAFERDRVFLWSQLWKEEHMKPTESRQSSSKQQLVRTAENYYQGNVKLLQSIAEFNMSYQRNDALRWCFHSPFPSRFLHQALRCRNMEHLELCRFLFTDISYILHRSNQQKTSRQLYRGMKLSDEMVDRLLSHQGKLICPKGFFTCIKSRAAALKFAWSLNHRSDLKPVLFKINCDATVPTGEIVVKNVLTQVVFDLYTTFRMTHVERGPVTVVRLQVADDDGRGIGRVYRAKHKNESLQILLDQLLTDPNPLPPVQRSLSEVKQTIAENRIAESYLLKDHAAVHEFLKKNEIDKALNYYQHLKPRTVQVLHSIGQIYADRKGDYESAILYYKEAIRIQEEKGENPAASYSQMAIAYENRKEYDQALIYHTRASELLQTGPNVSQASVANTLLGLANAQWGQQNLTEALTYAKKALVINESVKPLNEKNLATNLAIIANIEYSRDNKTEALKYATQALTLLERSVPADSPTLAALLNNVATIQLSIGAYDGARQSFERALKICEMTLSEDHPQRTTMATNLKRVTEIEQYQAQMQQEQQLESAKEGQEQNSPS